MYQGGYYIGSLCRKRIIRSQVTFKFHLEFAAGYWNGILFCIINIVINNELAQGNLSAEKMLESWLPRIEHSKKPTSLMKNEYEADLKSNRTMEFENYHIDFHSL